MEVGDRCRYSGEAIRAILPGRDTEHQPLTYVTSSAVCQVTESWGLSRFAAIPLRQITSIAYERRSSPLAAMLAVAAAACGILLALVAMRTRSPVFFFALAGGAGGLAVALLMVYLGSRSEALRISSPTESIRLELVAGAVPLRLIRLLMQEPKSSQIEEETRREALDQDRDTVGQDRHDAGSDQGSLS